MKQYGKTYMILFLRGEYVVYIVVATINFMSQLDYVMIFKYLTKRYSSCFYEGIFR